jgi:hypothetical protein
MCINANHNLAGVAVPTSELLNLRGENVGGVIDVSLDRSVRVE